MDLTSFDFNTNNFLDDELKSQCISYIFSCSIADILKNQNVKPSFVSGYSMGIYAALYYCRTISFKDGLIMLKNVWDSISEVTAKGKYGMGMIIGLDESDLMKFLLDEKEVEICNQNNPLTFIISGSLTAVERILLLAKTEGALRANLLPVSNPYHSQFLGKANSGFTEVNKGLLFHDPAYRYISALDQQIIETADGLKKEIISNITNGMHWYNTMNFLIKHGTDIFFECGAGDSLTRNARFVGGDFKSFSISKLDKFFETLTKQ